MRTRIVRKAAAAIIPVAAAAGTAAGVYAVTPVDRPPTAVPQGPAATPPPPSETVSTPTPTSTSTPAPATSTRTSTPRATSTWAAGSAGVPIRLRIPALGVDASVVSTGVTAAGALEVPARVSTVGWDRYTSQVGAPGTAVIAGHVNGSGVRGALWNLAAARLGQQVTLDTPARPVVYRITRVQTVPKTGLPDDIAIPATTGPHRLALVTCGGEFDWRSGHYRDNVIVWATAA